MVCWGEVGILGTAAAVSGLGAEVELAFPEERVEGLAGPWKTRAPASAAAAA